MNNPSGLALELIHAFRSPAPAQGADTRPRTRSAPAPAGRQVHAPEADQHRSDFLTTLRTRRSTRFFDPSPIAVEALADSIAAGIGADARSWPQDQRDLPLETDVVVFNVAELAPAMYRFESAQRRFTPVAPLPATEDRHKLTLQSEFCQSSAIISIAVDIASATDRYGAHGYRTLLSRASAAAYTMWLDAVSQGLVGTVFAGFIPSAVRDALHSDGTARQHVFALALGAQAREG